VRWPRSVLPARALVLIYAAVGHAALGQTDGQIPERCSKLTAVDAADKWRLAVYSCSLQLFCYFHVPGFFSGDAQTLDGKDGKMSQLSTDSSLDAFPLHTVRNCGNKRCRRRNIFWKYFVNCSEDTFVGLGLCKDVSYANVK